MSTALLQVALLPADLVLLGGAIRMPQRWPIWVVVYACLSFVGVVVAVQLWGAGLFAVMQGACWAIFLHLPLCLMAFRSRPLAGLGVLLGAIGADAFGVEPHWLEVTHVAIPGLPLRIALIADFQTDQMGAYEALVLQTVADQSPDLLLFAGDYLQVSEEEFPEQARLLNLALAKLHAPYGGIAVKGDVDDRRWTEIFAGTEILAVPGRASLKRGPVTVTALTPDDSRAPILHRPDPVVHRDGFHIVLGHAPDIALASPPADLILAGHTHGGQVRLFGWPLLTLSKVPRAWAAGVTALPGGGTLVVSRGIGMERRDAPRIRFLCRPQLVVLDPG